MNKALEFLAYGAGSVLMVGSVILALWGFGWIWNQTIGEWLDYNFNDSRVNLRNLQLAGECREAGYTPYMKYPGIGCDIDKPFNTKGGKNAPSEN